MQFNILINKFFLYLFILSLIIFFSQCSINKKFDSHLIYNPQIKRSFIKNKWEQSCHIQEYKKDANPNLIRWKFLVSPQKNTRNIYKRKRESHKHLTECINYFFMERFFESNPLIILKPKFKPIQKQIFSLLREVKIHQVKFDSLQNLEALIYIRAPQVRKILNKNILPDQ